MLISAGHVRYWAEVFQMKPSSATAVRQGICLEGTLKISVLGRLGCNVLSHEWKQAHALTTFEAGMVSV